MKKILLLLLVTTAVISLLVTFTITGCKAEAVEEEAVEAEAVEEEAVEEEAEVEEEPAEAEKPYDGVELTIGLLSRALSEDLNNYLPEFEAETGIKVFIELYQYDALRDKMMLQFVAGSGYFDMIYLSPGFLGELVENDYILDIAPLADEVGFQSDDFATAAMDISSYPGYGTGEEMWGYPYYGDSIVLVYRKDLFEDPEERADFKEEFGYDMPTFTIGQFDEALTTDEFLDLAKFFTRDTDNDGEIDFWGYAGNQGGVAYSNMYALNWITTFGGGYYDEDFNITFNSPQAIAALEYALELQQYLPPGVLGWDLGQMGTAFKDGKLAMANTWMNESIGMNDPEQSGVAGNVGYFVVPFNPESGLKSGKSFLGGGSLAITKDSRNPEAAFTWANWMFGDRDRAMQWYMNTGAFALKDVFEAPEVLEKYPYAEEFFPVAVYSLNNVATQRPTVPVAFSLYEVLGATWQNIALGRETVEDGLNRATIEAQVIMDEWLASR